MDQRAQYLIQIFEKIGAPLVAAVVACAPEDEDQAQAQKVAELLTKTVKLGIDIADMADLGALQGDSVRVALSGIASPLLAEAFRSGKQVPSDGDLQKITSALQAVLTFSENFTPDLDNAERLSALAAQGAGLDAHQMNIQYIQAFIPVINAIGRFSFGQPEQKLIMDVSIRVTAEASNLRKALLGELPEIDQKRADLAILGALIAIYTACHEAETQRLSEGKDAQDGGSVEAVWAAYETRLAMLEVLAKSLMPDAQVVAQGAGDVQTPSTPLKVETPVAEKSESPQNPEVPKESAPSESSANPMSMFSKPKEAETPKVEPSPAPEEVPSEVAAPEAPPEQPPVQDAPPSEKKEEGSGEKSSGGGPMAFFKKKEGE